MIHSDIVSVLETLQSAGTISAGWVVRGEEYELAPGDSITQEQLAAALDQVTEAQATAASRATSRAALRAVWDNLPAYIRGPYRPQFEAANRLLDDGHDEEASALIQYASACLNYDQVQIDQFNAAKSILLDGIESLIDDHSLRN
jgi:hypothetical protein